MFSATLQNQNLAADDEVSTSDSGFCPSFSGGSSVQSQVQSQVDSYIFENGRRYHSYHAGNYVCPNDERELERLEVYHHIFMLILGGALHTAPLNDPELILDVGAGTGTWCIEMNEKYPDANIIGIDLSHIEYSLPNCTFEVDDAENDWLWPQNHFDYIHFRCMVGAICDWEQFLIRCFDHLKPGGYAEFQDFSGILATAGPDRSTLDSDSIVEPSESPFNQWWSLVVETNLLTGRDTVIACKMKGMMERTGFVDVNVVVKPWPMTIWPENAWLNAIGTWGRRGMVEALSSYSGALLTRTLGWSHREVDELVNDARNDLMNKDSRYWAKTYFIHARKPLIST